MSGELVTLKKCGLVSWSIACVFIVGASQTRLHANQMSRRSYFEFCWQTKDAMRSSLGDQPGVKTRALAVEVKFRSKKISSLAAEMWPLPASQSRLSQF